ncbi:MAG: Uma2 family endonuclease [bacterium]|nr:Uma2 family endonuclease [bacterium]
MGNYRTPRRFEADEIREGDPYELSGGYKVECLPTGGRGSDAAATGTAVLKSDPAVESAGVDTGYSPAPDTLRAPDVAVGNVPNEPGWVKGVPPLAVEYADTGQNEADLEVKIRELLDAGTRLIWVVRLTGPRRVEVHEAGREMRTVEPGDELWAPGILRNPVPVEALYDWEVGREVTLRNLLQRHGYDSLEEVRAEGKAATLRRSILEVLSARELSLADTVRSAIDACQDPVVLNRWLRRAATADSADQVTAEAGGT